MTNKFMAGTKLYAFECMMQQIPCLQNEERICRKQKGKYISFLKQYMNEYGYSCLFKKVIKSLSTRVFDDYIFCSDFHKEVFWKTKSKHSKNGGKTNNIKTAVIYLLSTNKVFYTTLENYVSNPLFRLPNMVKGDIDEESYAIYHAVKLILGMETGLYEEDLFDNEVLSDSVLCLIINAKMIARYGINAYENKACIHQKPKYINGSHRNNRRIVTYEFNGNQVRIK